MNIFAKHRMFAIRSGNKYPHRSQFLLSTPPEKIEFSKNIGERGEEGYWTSKNTRRY